LRETLGKRMQITAETKKLGVPSTPVASLRGMIKKDSTENLLLKKLDSTVAPEFKFYDDFMEGLAAVEIGTSKGVWEGLRESVAKFAFTAFEDPIWLMNKTAKLSEKPAKKVISPLIKYGLKPAIAQQYPEETIFSPEYYAETERILQEKQIQ